jgi:hypothetical protein
MIVDKLLSPSIKQPLNVGLPVGTTTLGQVMDWGAARNQGLLAKPYGPGWDINIRNATSGGAATATLLLVTDDNAALSSPTTLFTSPTYTLSQLAKMDLFVPVPETDLWERYVAWRITVGTAVFTGGTISLEYVADVRKWRGYPAQGNR